MRERDSQKVVRLLKLHQKKMLEREMTREVSSAIDCCAFLIEMIENDLQERAGS